MLNSNQTSKGTIIKIINNIMATREQRLAIQLDTIRAFQQGHYKSQSTPDEKNILININDVQKAIQSTKYHSYNETEYILTKVKPQITMYEKTEVIIFNKDIFNSLL
jgi:hypothetical protein